MVPIEQVAVDIEGLVSQKYDTSGLEGIRYTDNDRAEMYFTSHEGDEYFDVTVIVRRRNNYVLEG